MADGGLTVVVGSDLHGSLYYTERLVEAFEREGADRLILLGDIYACGVNTRDYRPDAERKLLESFGDKLTVFRGNCDYGFDEDTSRITMLPTQTHNINGISVTFTHGHIYNDYNLPRTCGRVLVFGHTHKNSIRRSGERIIVNVGSAALPREGHERSYLLIKDNVFTLKELESGAYINSITVTEND